MEVLASQRRLLTRLMLLSIAAALVTIALKMLAWRLTGSAGLLSDALESIVNLAAALPPQMEAKAGAAEVAGLLANRLR
jgi:divalent metal cation (Fe/Co/Zn/Cd) transporter